MGNRSNQKQRGGYQRPRTRWSAWNIFIGVLVTGGVAGLALLAILGKPGAEKEIPGVRLFSDLARGHQTEPVTYAETPPVGGIHNPVWQNCGMYSKPVANENAVHSMEHGAVWITYRPDLPETDVKALRDLGRRSFVLVSPYPGLPAPVVVTAWGVQLQVEKASDSRLQQFLRKYTVGPTTPEPGAPCTGGVGAPE